MSVLINDCVILDDHEEVEVRWWWWQLKDHGGGLGS